MTTVENYAVAGIRFVLIGGFLGAGKTTLVSRLAAHYMAQGLRVGIVTNDQAADLVDTQTLRGQGFEVGEVAGACFCCSFDNLLQTAGELGRESPPDVILAEPVGSCTDLVATVILPLEQLYGQRFSPAPFGVLLKPSHGRRILGVSGERRRSGFSPQAEYIFRKQLEEADYLMIGRADELSSTELDQLRQVLAPLAPDVPVLAVSPKTGAGLEAVLAEIESEGGGRRVLEIDYDIYAAGEAELGWVNLTATVERPNGTLDLDVLTERIAQACGEHLAGETAEIAHLKCVAMADGLQSVANLVHTGGKVDHALSVSQPVAGPVRVVVNARVAIDPQKLETICRRSVEGAAASLLGSVSDVSSHALRPGRPEPTHRLAASGRE
ncbi:CobW-like GTP-binding protein [Candidatus Laterigemmans baculatus]|uniref:CobW-like GTP-binding protein n=1 Tax=Candidatus Laterigemmans baculatus TaxID=2770505 RepID=UPI001F1B5EE7|nr:CobW-like GTP-binding protein [Candidatus Laterigemmans baculatus]